MRACMRVCVHSLENFIVFSVISHNFEKNNSDANSLKNFADFDSRSKSTFIFRRKINRIDVKIDLLQEIDKFCSVKQHNHKSRLISRFWLILLILSKFPVFSRERDARSSPKFPKNCACSTMRIVLVAGTGTPTTEAPLNDGTIIGARVELRYACLLLADGRSLAFAASHGFFLLQSVARRDSCGMTKVCPLSLAPFQDYSPLRDRFYPCSPFLPVSLYSSISISLCLSFQSWHNLGQAGTAVIATWSELSRQRSFFDEILHQKRNAWIRFWTS